MRYFADAEFNGFGGDLISFAAIPEDATLTPFYEATDCLNPTDWVRHNVLPVLKTRPRPMADISRLFAEFLADDSEPIIVADWPEDIAHAAQLLTDRRGSRVVKCAVRFELLSHADFSADRASAVPHNAYYDALALRDWIVSTG